VHTVVLRAGLDEHAAADVFQTVFERLHSALPTLREPDRLSAWIVTTARRETLQALRRRRRETSLDALRETGENGDGPAFDPAAPDPLPAELLDDLQQLHLLRLALERLDERCRSLLSLLFADGDERPAYAEIGARLGMPAGSLGPTRARCLAKLRRLFDGGGAAG
jgi:RNA polymerase sigma factor (sigma-70 family)